MRAVASSAPPGGNATTIVMGRLRKARRENRHRERVYDLHDNSPALYRCRRHRPIEIFSPFLWVPATEMRCVRLHVQRLSRGCPLRVRYWGQNGRDADIEFLFNFEV